MARAASAFANSSFAAASLAAACLAASARAIASHAAVSLRDASLSASICLLFLIIASYEEEGGGRGLSLGLFTNVLTFELIPLNTGEDLPDAG